MLRDPAWREWYRAQHERRCMQWGNQFEDYVASVLSRFHRDYVNPTPAGALGDGGCDGLAEAGTILYACYGVRTMQNAERRLADKMRHDFERALTSWTTIRHWRFVTNAAVGPLCAKFLTEVQQQHGPDSNRPIQAVIWTPDHFWYEVTGRLSFKQLDDIFPGVPRGEAIELADLIPLLDTLDSDSIAATDEGPIRPVPIEKMDYNGLSLASRIEFNEGRLMASRIAQWYNEQDDPDLLDHHGQNFRRIYEMHRQSTSNPTEILERLYTSLGGSDFRFDARRANAVYAITAYFFDLCHIFETPPPEYVEGGVDGAASK